MGCIGSIGDAVFHSPQDGINVEAVLWNIHEGILTGCVTAAAAGAVPVVTQSGDLLLGDQDLAADGALRALGQAGLGAGGLGGNSPIAPAVLVGLLMLFTPVRRISEAEAKTYW